MRKALKTAFALGFFAVASNAMADLNIGDQRANARSVMEAAGVLANVPYTINWHEFANSAPVLEAIASGHLDAGMMGDASLTYAAAAGVKAKAIFVTNYYGNAVIAAKNSTFQSVKDLKGKKIATPKGSAGHASALLALSLVGLGKDDVTFVSMTPSEATLALNSGAVDAVALWDPYISFAVLQTGARILMDGDQLPTLNYFAASDDAIKNKREDLKDFTRRLAQARVWATQHPDEYSEIIAKLLRLPIDVAKLKVKREVNEPFNDYQAILKRQQATIDLYADAKLIDASFPASNIVDGSFIPKEEQPGGSPEARNQSAQAGAHP